MRNPKKYKLFYSWQSDNKASDKLIRTALNRACEEIQNSCGITIELDYSTLGLSGMPNITQAILEKIDECDIFLADITPIVSYNKVDGNGITIKKEVPNPNVLLELGYAMSAVGVEYVIPVAHQGKWTTSELPFDINHHSLYIFTASSIDLTQSILGIIDYIKKNGRHRHKAVPYFIHKCSIFVEHIRNKLSKSHNKYANTITCESTVFFRMRICDAFPGVRELKVYTSCHDIHKHLSKLLEKPLKFEKSIRGTIDPMWWFRGSYASEISKFKWLGGRHYLIELEEVVISRIAVYSDNGRYYSNYVYIETEAQKPTGLYKYTEEAPKDEEYAVYRYGRVFRKKITRQEVDDGSTHILGQIHRLKAGNIELRIRYLNKSNFIIAAKASPYNSKAFCASSDCQLENLLTGKIDLEQFNDYMLRFPKSQYDF